VLSLYVPYTRPLCVLNVNAKNLCFCHNGDVAITSLASAVSPPSPSEDTQTPHRVRDRAGTRVTALPSPVPAAIHLFGILFLGIITLASASASRPAIPADVVTGPTGGDGDGGRGGHAQVHQAATPGTYAELILENLSRAQYSSGARRHGLRFCPFGTRPAAVFTFKFCARKKERQ
jgi:hypothetical protein